MRSFDRNSQSRRHSPGQQSAEVIGRERQPPGTADSLLNFSRRSCDSAEPDSRPLAKRIPFESTTTTAQMVPSVIRFAFLLKPAFRRTGHEQEERNLWESRQGPVAICDVHAMLLRICVLQHGQPTCCFSRRGLSPGTRFRQNGTCTLQPFGMGFISSWKLPMPRRLLIFTELALTSSDQSPPQSPIRRHL